MELYKCSGVDAINCSGVNVNRRTYAVFLYAFDAVWLLTAKHMRFSFMILMLFDC